MSTTFTFAAGTSKTFSITPFSASTSCGTQTNGFTYSAMKLDTTPIPSFISVSSTTGAISVSALSTVGTYSLIVVGTLYNSQTTSQIFTLTGIVDTPPTLVSSPLDVYVAVGGTQTTVISSFIETYGFSVTM